MPRQRAFSTHSEFRPTVQRGLSDDPNAHVPGELLDEDLEYDDLVELYGYDEGRGLEELVLEKGDLIKIPLKDEYDDVTWVDGMVTSTTKGSLNFKVVFPGCEIDSGKWSQTRSRAEMEKTWRLPPATRRRQPGVRAILSTQGYTPWHHSHSGSHWLRLQPRGAWQYKTHNIHGSSQGKIFGWRMGLSILNMDDHYSGGHDFKMCSFVEDHMTREDLGADASTQDWVDFQNLGRELRRWEDLGEDSQVTVGP